MKFVLHDPDASFTAGFNRLPGCRDQDHPQRGAGTTDELDHGTLDRQLRRKLLDQALIWNPRHLMIAVREYEDFYNTHGRTAP